MLCIGTNAYANSGDDSLRGPYVTVKLGRINAGHYEEKTFGTAKLDFDAGSTVSIATGFIRSSMRIEAELSRSKLSAGKWTIAGPSIPSDPQINLSGDQTLVSILLSGYWQPQIDDHIYALMGIGAGYTQVSWNDVTSPTWSSGYKIDDSDEVFSYKAGLGLGFRVSDTWSIEGVFHYLKLDDFSLTDNTGITGLFVDTEHHLFDLGVRYSF